MRYFLYLHVMGMALIACTNGSTVSGQAGVDRPSDSPSTENPIQNTTPGTTGDNGSAESGASTDDHQDAGSGLVDPETPSDSNDTGATEPSSPAAPESDDTVLMDESHWPADTGFSDDIESVDDGIFADDTGALDADDTGTVDGGGYQRRD